MRIPSLAVHHGHCGEGTDLDNQVGNHSSGEAELSGETDAELEPLHQSTKSDSR